MGALLKNNAFGSLASEISNVALTCVLNTGHGARFPTPSAGNFFYATLVGFDGNGIEASWEVIKVTGKSADTLTIVRAQDNTNATTWSAGTRLEMRANAAIINAKMDQQIGLLINTFNSTLSTDGAALYFAGRDTLNDGGGGWFTFSSGSVATADGGIVFAPTGGGRLLRDGYHALGFNNDINAMWFGVKANGTTNDSAALQSAIDAAAATGGGKVYYTGRPFIESSITVKDYVHLVGPLDISEEILPGASAAYQNKPGFMLLGAGVTITLKNSSSFSGGGLIRGAMTLPFADATAAAAGISAFAGTAITIGGAGAYIHHALILGFSRAIDGANYERTRCEYVFGDCTNGIKLDTVYDIAYIENCHFWPFTTAHQIWTSDALMTRSGAAYELSNVGDWSKLTNCFSYGYLQGINITSCDHVQIIGCGADYPSSLAATSVGVTIGGTSRDALLLGQQCAAQGTGILINSTATNKLAARIIGADCWNNDSYHIRVQDGAAAIIGCTATDGPVGVLIDSASDGSLVDGCTFSGVTTPISSSGNALEKSQIGCNNFINCVDSIGVRKNFDNQAKSDIATSYNTSGAGFDFVARYSRGTAQSPTISQNGDVALTIAGKLYDGVAFRDIARIRIAGAASPSAGSTPGRLILSTVPSGSTTLVDRIIVESNGDLLPLLTASYSLGASANRWSNAYIDTLRPGDGSAKWTSGAGSPEGVLSAVVGSIWLRTDGGANTTFYIKETGSGNTGWVAK